MSEPGHFATLEEMVIIVLLDAPEDGIILEDVGDNIVMKWPVVGKLKKWKSAVRHILFRELCFSQTTYRWAIHPACMELFKKGDFNIATANLLVENCNKENCIGKRKKRQWKDVPEEESSKKPKFSESHRCPAGFQQYLAEVQQFPTGFRQCLEGFQQYLAEFRQCPAEFRQCPAEFRQCPAEFRQCPAEFPQCSAEFPQCPAEFPQCPAEIQQCPVEIQQYPAEIPQCPAEIPQCPAEIPQCPAEIPQCPAEIPQCPAEIPQCTENSQQCSS